MTESEESGSWSEPRCSLLFSDTVQHTNTERNHCPVMGEEGNVDWGTHREAEKAVDSGCSAAEEPAPCDGGPVMLSRCSRAGRRAGSLASGANCSCGTRKTNFLSSGTRTKARTSDPWLINWGWERIQRTVFHCLWGGSVGFGSAAIITDKTHMWTTAGPGSVQHELSEQNPTAVTSHTASEEHDFLIIFGSGMSMRSKPAQWTHRA